MSVSISTKKIVFAICTAALLLTAASCEKLFDGDKPADDPVAVFEELWKLVDERYALFSVKGVDWNAKHAQYRGQVHADMNNQQLFAVLNNMLSELKDGHITLISPTDTAGYDQFYMAFPANFNFQNIANNYLQNDYELIGPVAAKIVNNVGYIYYGSFRHDITEAQADELLQYMSGTKGLIIDVRHNTGGKSPNVNVLFSRFIREKMLVKFEKRKKGKGHNDFFDPEPYYIFPAPVVYGAPVAVLTNRSCFSVCNDFALFMSQLPQVKLIGDQTGGGGAIPFQYILANGWKVQYSGTITLSPEQLPVENGIQPDTQINITPIDESMGRDPILEQAYQSLQ